MIRRLVALLLACVGGTASARTGAAAALPATPEVRMDVDPALVPVEGAETSPLAADVFVRYQVISLGKGCRGNLRFVLHDDGRLFFARNERSDCPYPQRFDRPYPERPSATLSPRQMAAVRETVAAQKVTELAPGYRVPVEDGQMEILDVREPGTPPRRVIAVGAELPAIKAIRARILALAKLD